MNALHAILWVGWLVMLLPTKTIPSLGPASCFPSGRASPGGGDLGVQMPSPLKRRHIPDTVLEDLRRNISYDPDTGIFTWILPRRKIQVGANAGYRSASYWEVSFAGHRILGHRLAWVLTNGPIPDDLQVDHINGDRLDNRIANLRLVTHLGNCENKHKAMSNSKSGILGVSWSKVMGKWDANIQVNKKKTNLGYFDDPHVAHEAYLQARRQYFPHNTL